MKGTGAMVLVGLYIAAGLFLILVLVQLASNLGW